MAIVRYIKNHIPMLYELKESMEIVTDTPVGKTALVSINERVKQRSIFHLITCNAVASKVNSINSTFMDI